MKAEWMSTPAMSSASSWAFLMASEVTSRLTTTPLRRPLDSAVPMPMTSILRSSVISPMRTADFLGADVDADDVSVLGH